MKTILLTKTQAAERVHLCPGHVMDLARQGRFPKPVKHGGRNGRVCFVESEVEAWIQDCIAKRDDASNSTNS